MIFNDFLYYTTLTLIYDVLYSFRLYYIQFKEFKIFWGPGAGGRGLDMRAGAGGRITQRPKQIQDAESLAEGNK